MAGLIVLKCGTFSQEYMVFQDRWSHSSGLKTGVTVLSILWSFKRGSAQSQVMKYMEYEMFHVSTDFGCSRPA